MEYIGLGIVIAVVIAAGIILYTKFKKHEAIPSSDLVSGTSTVIGGKNDLTKYHQENELVIQMEILENDELRLSKIAQLDSLEEECTQLLGQANLTLAGFAKKTGLDYEAYEKALGNV